MSEDAEQLKFKHIFESSRDAIMLLDRDGFFDCNEATLRLFGLDSREEFIQYSPGELSPSAQPNGESSFEATQQHIERAFEEGEDFFEWTHQRKGGENFPAEVQLSRVDLEDRPVLQALIRDITERKRRERKLDSLNQQLDALNQQLEAQNQQLRATEKHLQQEIHERKRVESRLNMILNTVSDPIFVKDENHCWIEVNDAFCEFMGYSRDELLGKSDYDFFPKEEADVFWEKDNLVFETGEDNVNEEYFTDADGNQHIISTKKSLFTVPGTGEKILVGVIRDITEYKKAKKQIEKEKEYTERIIRNFLDTLIATDTDGNITKINEATVELLGYSEEDLIGEPVTKIFAPGEASLIERFFSDRINGRWNSGNLRNLDLHYQTSDGELIPMSFNISIIRDDNGKLRGIVAGAKDISALKEVQEELGNQLQEKKTLLREVHHRVKNNLFTMISFLEMELMLSESEETRSVLEVAINRLHTMALIHQHIYSREDITSLSFSDFLKELCEEIISTLRDPGTQIEFDFDIDEMDLTLDQVIPCGLAINELLTNAVSHGFEGRENGKMEVVFKKIRETAELIVRDDGRGLPSGFNLNDDASLGLRLVKSIVENQLDGSLDFSSHEKTEFKINFSLVL